MSHFSPGHIRNEIKARAVITFDLLASTMRTLHNAQDQPARKHIPARPNCDNTRGAPRTKDANSLGSGQRDRRQAERQMRNAYGFKTGSDPLLFPRAQQSGIELVVNGIHIQSRAVSREVFVCRHKWEVEAPALIVGLVAWQLPRPHPVHHLFITLSSSFRFFPSPFHHHCLLLQFHTLPSPSTISYLLSLSLHHISTLPSPFTPLPSFLLFHISPPLLLLPPFHPLLSPFTISPPLPSPFTISPHSSPSPFHHHCPLLHHLPTILSLTISTTINFSPLHFFTPLPSPFTIRPWPSPSPSLHIYHPLPSISHHSSSPFHTIPFSLTFLHLPFTTISPPFFTFHHCPLSTSTFHPLHTFTPLLLPSPFHHIAPLPPPIYPFTISPPLPFSIFTTIPFSPFHHHCLLPSPFHHIASPSPFHHHCLLPSPFTTIGCSLSPFTTIAFPPFHLPSLPPLHLLISPFLSPTIASYLSPFHHHSLLSLALSFHFTTIHSSSLHTIAPPFPLSIPIAIHHHCLSSFPCPLPPIFTTILPSPSPHHFTHHCSVTMAPNNCSSLPLFHFTHHPIHHHCPHINHHHCLLPSPFHHHCFSLPPFHHHCFSLTISPPFLLPSPFHHHCLLPTISPHWPPFHHHCFSLHHFLLLPHHSPPCFPSTHMTLSLRCH
ncbi:hypothetical protein C7M84_019816 [Penaeus vannamei]|uniref:Uncharacterized protein n=1 Tax=Penaeus vannamei TaxID=6689 RepID=A0A3R7MI70_PENVA|nr:hypothetical protein C7M84_019816 [Penaeus vannamei]